MMKVHVKAVRWDHGWELHIEGFGVTQTRNLAGAEAMVRDYIADDVVNVAAVDVDISADVPGCEDAAYLRAEIAETSAKVRAQAVKSRRMAQALKKQVSAGRMLRMCSACHRNAFRSC